MLGIPLSVEVMYCSVLSGSALIFRHQIKSVPQVCWKANIEKADDMRVQIQ